MFGLIEIRSAGVGDAELIADMSRRTFYDSFATQNTTENMDLFLRGQFSREMLIAETNDPGSIFLLAFLDGVPAGYTRMRKNGFPQESATGSAIEIARIYSEQWAIGKGIGRSLMEECLEIAGRMEKEWIWLGVWEQNVRAIRFYKKWGFEKFGEHIFVVGNDPQKDWLMKKKIGS